jgi:hypothetical protein
MSLPAYGNPDRRPARAVEQQEQRVLAKEPLDFSVLNPFSRSASTEHYLVRTAPRQVAADSASTSTTPKAIFSNQVVTFRSADAPPAAPSLAAFMERMASMEATSVENDAGADQRMDSAAQSGEGSSEAAAEADHDRASTAGRGDAQQADEAAATQTVLLQENLNIATMFPRPHREAVPKERLLMYFPVTTEADSDSKVLIPVGVPVRFQPPGDIQGPRSRVTVRREP